MPLLLRFSGTLVRPSLCAFCLAYHYPGETTIKVAPSLGACPSKATQPMCGFGHLA
jgi:hypothetical protein